MPSPLSCLRPQDPNRRASKELDKKIAFWMKQYKKSIKLLLLGAGESGKTTIIKQMKILHDEGFSMEERQEKATEIRRNVLESIKEITSNMAFIKPPVSLHDTERMSSLNFIKDIDIMCPVYVFTEDFYYHVERLWTDLGVQECFHRSNEYPLIDSAKYFLDRVSEVKQIDYLPDDQDVLRCRKRTSDIQKIEFEVKVPSKYGGGGQLFWMFDVGGQRGERRKWIQVFDGITAVLFLVSSSGFDSKIREDNETNRLQESLGLFEEVWSSRFLRDSGFILFLNKQDMLREKIEQGAQLGRYFPDYNDFHLAPADEEHSSSNREYLRARSFIRDKFLSITKKQAEHRKQSTTDYYYQNFVDTRPRECFWHYTTATDTENVKKVFDDIHTMIIMINLLKISPS